MLLPPAPVPRDPMRLEHPVAAVTGHAVPAPPAAPVQSDDDHEMLYGIPEAIGTSEDFPLTARMGDYMGQPRGVPGVRAPKQPKTIADLGLPAVVHATPMEALLRGGRGAMDPNLLPRDDDFDGLCIHLIEECAELIKAVTKMRRFGQHATDRKTERTYNNAADVITEHAQVDLAYTRVLKHLKP